MTKILIIKLSSLGDLFRPLPVVHLLKKHLGAQVDWVTQPEYVELLSNFTDVRRVYAFPRRNFLSSVGRYIREVRSEEYDYIIDLQGLLKSAVAGRLARGKTRIGPSFHREGSHLLYDAVAGTCDKERHSTEEMLDVVRYLGLPVDEAWSFPVRFGDYDLGNAKKPFVGILPCSRWTTKNWSANHFAILINQLCERDAGTVFLLGGPADHLACDEIMSGVNPGSDIRDLCGKTSICELGAVLQQMKLVVSVDSGPLHMASALGVPVVSMFGATDAIRTGPCGGPSIILTENDLACRPCFSRTCSRGDLACLERITPERVLDACRQFLPAEKELRKHNIS